MSVDQLDGVKQKIIEALRNHRVDGMTPRELAQTIKLSRTEITMHLTDLRRRGFAMKDPNRAQRDNQIIWFSDEEGLQQLNSRFRAQERKCLGGCGQMFMSQHAGNRICEKCSGADEDNVQDYGVAAITGWDMQRSSHSSVPMKHR